MPRQKKEPPLSIRFDAHTLEGLAKIEAKTGKGKAEIVRQSVDAVLAAFESDGDLKFPVMVVSAAGPQLTEEMIRKTMERLFREQAEAQAVARASDFVSGVFERPEELLLMALERYRASDAYDSNPETAAPGSVACTSHGGDEFYAHVVVVDETLNAPPKLIPDTLFLLKNPRAYVDFPVRIVEIPWGSSEVDGCRYIIARDWEFTDMPKVGSLVIVNHGGKRHVGRLQSRKGKAGEPVDSKGNVYVVKDAKYPLLESSSEKIVTRHNIISLVVGGIPEDTIIWKPETNAYFTDAPFRAHPSSYYKKPKS